MRRTQRNRLATQKNVGVQVNTETFDPFAHVPTSPDPNHQNGEKTPYLPARL
jgi:hypothetical protein